MPKTINFRFTHSGIEKTISTPEDSPFKYVVQFAIESFEISSRVSRIDNYESKAIDTNLTARQVWQVYGCDAMIRLNS